MRAICIAAIISLATMPGCLEAPDAAGPAPQVSNSRASRDAVSAGSPKASAAAASKTAARDADDPETMREQALRAIRQMRTEDERIRAQFDKLEVGMTEPEVLRLMGDPDKVEKQRWDWRISPASQWIDETTRVFGYYVVLENGRVKWKSVHGAHYTFARPENGRP